MFIEHVTDLTAKKLYNVSPPGLIASQTCPSMTPIEMTTGPEELTGDRKKIGPKRTTRARTRYVSQADISTLKKPTPG